MAYTQAAMMIFRKLLLLLLYLYLLYYCISGMGHLFFYSGLIARVWCIELSKEKRW